MFYKLKIRWLGKRNTKKKTYLRGRAQMTSIIIGAPLLSVIVSPSSLLSHRLGVCLIIHSRRDGKSVPSSGPVQCNNYKLHIKIEYISYITEPKKRYLNQMIVCSHRICRWIGSQGTYGDQNGWLSNRCGTVADTMVSG